MCLVLRVSSLLIGTSPVSWRARESDPQFRKELSSPRFPAFNASSFWE